MAKGRELELAIKIAGKLDGSLGRAINSAQAQLDRIGKTANRVGTLATAAAIGAGVKIVKDSIKTYSEYETAVNSAAAVFDTPKGTKEYEQLEEAARQVGLTTVKSAKEGANALEYMGLAGWSVADSTKALIPVVKLSASTGMDLATTSDLVTDTMAAMGISIDGVGHYLDVLAKGNNSANYTSQMLLESFANVGGVFRSLNVGVEDGAAVLGILANQGTKGSEAGTQLNTVLTRMQKQSGEAYKGMQQLGISMFDAQGNARNIIDVFGDMYKATKNMTDEQRNQIFTLIGGTRGYRALTKIMSGYADSAENGTPIIRALAAAYRDADGALDNFYDIKTDTMAGGIERLKRLWEDMQITLGGELAPGVNELVEHLSEKMPEISEAIISTIEGLAPAVMDFMDYLIDNLPSIIKHIAAFAKGFAAFKIGSGILRTLSDFTLLLTNLQKIAAGKGIAKVISGIVKAFTGINTSALASAFPAISGFISSIVSAAAPIAGVAAAIAAVGLAIDIFDKHFHYTRNMDKYTEGISQAAQELIKYNDLANEVAKQREIITNPESDNYQIDAAKQKLQEIADMLGLTYSFNISCDSSQIEEQIDLLDTAIDKQRALSGQDLLDNSTDLISTINNSTYQDDVRGKVHAEALAKQYEIDDTNYGGIAANADLVLDKFNTDMISEAEYISEMNNLYQRAQTELGYRSKDLPFDTIESSNQAALFHSNFGMTADRKHTVYDNQLKAIERYDDRITETEDAARETTDSLTALLSSQTNIGDKSGINSTVELLNSLGEAMVNQEMSTDDLAVKVAAAKLGFTDFNEALGENGQNAQKLAQNYLDYKTSIGETAESAVAGAALIANGYSNSAQAAKASSETMTAFFSDMLSFGNAQGIFDGLDTGGIADKLTDMAHAINLIPENKAIRINADGNFEVIQEAENQIASLKSVGNVDVSVNAAGDVTILDEAGNVLNKLQDVGAVDLEVNADGNIDVLNDAQKVLATIDKNTGEIIYVDASLQAGNVDASGLENGVNEAANEAANNGGQPADVPKDVNVQAGKINASDLILALAGGLGDLLTPTTASAAEITQDVTVQSGNVDITPVQNTLSGIRSGLPNWNGATPTTVTQDVTVQAGNIDTTPLQSAIAGIRSGLPNWGGTTTTNITVNGTFNGRENLTAAVGYQSQLQNTNVMQTVTGIFNGQAVITTALSYQNRLQNKSVAYTVTGTFSGQAAIATALSYQGQLASKSVTYTVTYKQVGTPPAHSATGAANWRGGFTYLNDQRGIVDPREVIEYGGARWWYEGRNVLADVPKGARIYTASQSRNIIDGSHRNGLDRVPFDGYIAELHQGERVLTAAEADGYDGFTLSDMLDMLGDMVEDMRSGGRSESDSGSGDRQIVFAPNITVNGGGDAQTVRQAVRLSYKEFKEMMREYDREQSRKKF